MKQLDKKTISNGFCDIRPRYWACIYTYNDVYVCVSKEVFIQLNNGVVVPVRRTVYETTFKQ